MATKAQILKRQMIMKAKQRKSDIVHKYDTTIPKILRCGNVKSTMERLEKVLSAYGKRKNPSGKGKRASCSHFSPLNYMEGNLVKMGRR